ncbi:hypothetical protein [Streptomyces neyagawaensis]|uniref:hypothetical protein n=1 Tax=Streptomyces neyagawaensis TaxID=42238 RepID=UPI0006E2C6A4|nr:hypothetical protein [Streptomyces neyagawaensis]MCL6734806.1 hypothetical protein [Streptomyces neyagawaensis]MDE1686528.1 hypothetical protein [Streptomyces neyagawaensis]
MPHTPVRPSRSDGAFADVFARRTRTPLRGFLPGRRVWSTVGGFAAMVLVITGATALVSQIDFTGGGDSKVTTAAEKKDAAKDKPPADSRTPTAASAAPAPAHKERDDGPAVVYVPAPGGGNAGSDGSHGSGGADDGSGAGTTRTSPPRSTAPTRQTSTSYLWSDGAVEGDSNPYWDQSTVTVQTTKALKSLKVVVKIAQTGGVASTGTWTNLGDKVSVASASASGELDYVVTLKPGVTVDPGTYIFRFQYNHNQGDRAPDGDRYNVTTTSTAGTTEYRKGGF